MFKSTVDHLQIRKAENGYEVTAIDYNKGDKIYVFEYLVSLIIWLKDYKFK